MTKCLVTRWLGVATVAPHDRGAEVLHADRPADLGSGLVDGPGR